MVQKRLNEEILAAISKDFEAGMKAAEIAEKHQISRQTIYNLRSKSNIGDASESRRLRILEDQNLQLKLMLADALLENSALRSGSGKRRTQANREE